MVHFFIDIDLSYSTNHRGPDSVVIVTADLRITVPLHFYLSLSPLITMSSMCSDARTNDSK
jgi:hypothetical protein